MNATLLPVLLALATLPVAAHAQTCHHVLRAPQADDYDRFGEAVGISADDIVVGEPGDDIAANGAGAARVFHRDGRTWTSLALASSSPRAGGDFGRAVAIDGDTLAIGAPGEHDGNGVQTGVVHVFVRNGTSWVEQARVWPADGNAGDRFGAAVALSGGRLLVGAPQDSDIAFRAGSAYLFTRRFSSWNLLVKLTAADGAAGDAFGHRVAIDATQAVVGAPYADPAQRDAAGAAYVFAEGSPLWYQTAKLTAPTPAASDLLGSSVALRGGTIVVGAPGDDERGNGAGAVHVFTRSPIGSWTSTKLVATEGDVGDQLGHSVAIGSGRIAAGAPYADFGSLRPGAVFVFDFSVNRWSQRARLLDPSGRDGDRLGVSVAVAADTVVAGALTGRPLEPELGTAQVFRIGGASIETFGAGCTGSNGRVPAHAVTSALIGSSTRFEGRDLWPNGSAVLWIGVSNTAWGSTALPLGLGFLGAHPACQLLVSPDVSIAAVVDGLGNVAWPITLSSASAFGTNLFTQILAIDLAVSSPLKIVASHGVRSVLGCP